MDTTRPSGASRTGKVVAALVAAGAAVVMAPALLHNDPFEDSAVGRVMTMRSVWVADVTTDGGDLVLRGPVVREDLSVLGGVERRGRVAPTGEVRVRNDNGVEIVGERLAVVIGFGAEYEPVAQYVHDLDADRPVDGIAEQRTLNGARTDEVMACLQAATGAATQLEALVEAVRIERRDPGRTDNPIPSCGY